MEGLVKFFEYIYYFYVVIFWIIAIVVGTSIVVVNVVVTWAAIENKTSIGWWIIAIIVYLGSFTVIQKMYQKYQHEKMCAANSETRYFRNKQGQLKVKEECISKRQKQKTEEYQKKHAAQYARNREMMKRRAEARKKRRAEENSRLDLHFDDYQHDGKFDDYYDDNFRNNDSGYEPKYD